LGTPPVSSFILYFEKNKVNFNLIIKENYDKK